MNQTDAPSQHGRLGIESNHLLGLLPLEIREELIAASDRFTLNIADALWETNELSEYVYFPVRGFISLVSMVGSNPGLEIGLIGREGLAGLHAILSDQPTPSRAMVQGEGWAWRIPVDKFTGFLGRTPCLRQVVDNYSMVVMSQLATSAACQKFHQIGPRVARWLLLCQDRANSDRFTITHEFLANAMGVRRSSISQAAGFLQKEGLISYIRGEVQVIDRPRLRNFACSCYDINCADHAKFLKVRPLPR